MKVSDFDFELPTELIATRPLARRDASRMLVVTPHPRMLGVNPRPCGGGRHEVPGGGFDRTIAHHQNYAPYIKEFAGNMRSEPTPMERKFWQAVRNKKLGGFIFRRQRQFDNKYIADFVCFEKKLIIEIDGSQHYENKSDEIRAEYLQKFGFNIIRFWNWDIRKNIKGCLEILLDILTENSFEKRMVEFNKKLNSGMPLKIDDFETNKPAPRGDAATPAARTGAEPDDKVLSIQDDIISDALITDFVAYLKPGDVVVFNNTKVIPARFNATAESGKIYEITLHTNKDKNVWLGFAKQFNKLNMDDILTLDDQKTQIKIISKNDDSGLELEFLCDDVFAVLDRVGKMPLPPYMHRAEEDADRERYQTIYADPVGSMAAPTAGLHFTDALLDRIRNAGAAIAAITLHVGAGTWMPVKSDDTDDHAMHAEWGVVPPDQAEIINAAKSSGARIFAIGTTSVRLLESAAAGDRVEPFCGTTRIFMTPGYRFKIADAMLTNFHLPKSTLFMLVSAFAGMDEMRGAYRHAIDEKYRFFSYGDACLLFKKEN